MALSFRSRVHKIKLITITILSALVLRRFMNLALYFCLIFALLLIYQGFYNGLVDHNNNTYNTNLVIKPKSYIILKSYVPAARSYTGNQSVTLTTQATTSYLNHVPMLCQRWDGPVSIAIYVGDGKQEFAKAFEIINYMRQCTHRCVLQNVTWHFVAEKDSEIPLFDSNEIFLPLKSWKPRWVDPEHFHCDAAKIAKYFEEKDFKRFEKAGHPYPINVARNLARKAATTFYVFPSDVELYPSTNIIPRFLRLVSSGRRNPVSGPHVYTLPIFEIEKGIEPPEDKATMVKVLKENRGSYFQKNICDPCFNFPGRDTWPDKIHSRDSLGIHAWDKRIHRNWEPFYIGTNSDPEYLEEESWEGLLDKMTQTFEMCVLNYTFYVFDNAFVVHSPGIKQNTKKNTKYRSARRPYELVNFFAHERRVAALKLKHQLSDETVKFCGDPEKIRKFLRIPQSLY